DEHAAYPAPGTRGVPDHAGAASERAQARSGERVRDGLVALDRELGPPRHRRRYRLRYRQNGATQEERRSALDAGTGGAHRWHAADPIHTGEGNRSHVVIADREEDRAAPRSSRRAGP